MSEERPGVSLRSFVEKLAARAALAAADGSVAGSALVAAATEDPATAAMNAGAFGMVLARPISTRYFQPSDGRSPTLRATRRNYVNLSNRGELLNNYNASSPSPLQTNMSAALGNGPFSGSAATGVIGSELRAPLHGLTRDGTTALSSVTAAALSAWATWARQQILATYPSCS